MRPAAEMGLPSSRMEPAVWFRNPARMFRRVVFPHPDNPTTQTNSPILNVEVDVLESVNPSVLQVVFHVEILDAYFHWHFIRPF